jgi:signal transduction histidine kinase
MSDKENERKVEPHFEKFINYSPFAIEILSSEGNIIKVNKAWMQLWNLNDEETQKVLANYNMLSDKQVRDKGILPLVRKAFNGESVILPPIKYSADSVTKDAGLIETKPRSPWIQCYLYAVKDGYGNIEYIVNTYVDLTDLKYAEQESREQREILARIGRATRMGQLTGSIAHELNQPLTGILSNAQAAELIINADKCDLEEIRKILALIVADTKRAGDIIRNLREIYREHKGEYNLIDINLVVEDVLKLLQSDLVSKHIQITTELASSSLMINGNRMQIQQVLVNLIMNSVEAMIDNTRGDRKLYVVALQENDKVKVWVDDNGSGINSDKIDQIFEPLITWKSGGTGMGLAIGNSIIKAHKGRMWAENKPERGARVGFIIPLYKKKKV